MKKAFTLIELIFVIVIIGLLAAVAVPRFLSTVQNAKFKPALAVTREIVRKWVEQYTQIQDPNLSRVVLKDPHIQRYLYELTTHVDKHFVWDVRFTEESNGTFAIGYKLNKHKYWGNVHENDPENDENPNPDNPPPIEVNDGYIGWFIKETDPPYKRKKRVTGTKTCIKVNVYPIQVPVDIEHNVTQYDIKISDINYSCIRASK